MTDQQQISTSSTTQKNPLSQRNEDVVQKKGFRPQFDVLTVGAHKFVSLEVRGGYAVNGMRTLQDKIQSDEFQATQKLKGRLAEKAFQWLEVSSAE